MKKTILAISSSGGHWEQLMMLKDSFVGHDVIYANSLKGLAARDGIDNAYCIDDCNRDTPLAVIKTSYQIFGIIKRHRPDVIISTGAAPGIIAIAIGRLFRAKTIWIDSVANAEKMSMSGEMAGYLAHLQLTQWKHLERKNGPKFVGAVL
jgi:hypothetical protein